MLLVRGGLGNAMDAESDFRQVEAMTNGNSNGGGTRGRWHLSHIPPEIAMKRSIRTGLLTLSLTALSIAPALASNLTLHLEDIRTASGHLQIALVDSEAGWNNASPPVHTKRIPATDGEIRLVFENLSPGQYAVMVMHDENDNGKLDTNLVGIPVEGYGFSNNPRVMRKPTWEESRFDVGDDDLAIHIQLR